MGDFGSGGDQMLEMFLFELSTLLEQLDEILLRSEHDSKLAEDDVGEIFRIMHTIKGSSAMMEFNIISMVTHKLEDLFFYVRDHGVPHDKFSRLFDLMLKVSDFLKAEVDNIQNGVPMCENNDELIKETTDFLAQISGKAPELKAPEPAKQAQPSAKTAPEVTNGKKNSITNTVHEGQYAYSVKFMFEDDCGMENLRAYMLAHTLSANCHIRNYSPDDVDTNSDTINELINSGFTINLSCDFDRMALSSMLEQIAHIKSFDITEVKDSIDQKAADPESVQDQNPGTAGSVKNIPAAPQKATKQNIINVNLSRLDKLMDLVGEIVITESMVTSSPDLKGLQLDNFSKASRQLRKLTDELQDTVMSIRMLPVSSTFQRMVRIVRDMSKALGKDADLTIVGEETEVDKTIIDGIGDPIMHLVRNAMDHGIETPSDRIKAGKPAKGKIVLSAQNNGGEILISISDDGKGLDKDYLIKKAKEKGMLTKPENEYSEKEAFNLLTLPGFSTKDAVTEFSGRGVGMDVVKKNIEKIGGSVVIESKKGHGTIIYFKIPLTLAIVDGMEISIGDGIFTIPITSIQESFKVEKKQIINDTGHNEMIMIRGVCYPVLRLHELYNISNAYTDIEDGILILVEADGKAVCLFVDKLLGEQQIVVKPIPVYLNKYDIKKYGISGCTMLGDGNITLILDVASIISKFGDSI